MSGVVEQLSEFSSVDKMVRRMLVRRGGSRGTVEAYCYGIKYFLEFLGDRYGLSFDADLAVEAFNEGKLDAFRVIDDFIDFYLEGHTNKYVRVLLYGVKRWLEVNYVDVDWKGLEFPASTRVGEVDRAPSKEDLQDVLKYGNLHVRDRAAVLIASSSGLRIGTLISLKVGDVDFSYPDIAKIKVESADGRKLSNGREYFTFITPEARKSVLEYFDWRERQGETLTDDSPLIGSLKKVGRPLRSRSGYSNQWIRILRRVGKTEKSRKWNVIHFHTLRKFFRTQCEIAGVPRAFWEFWMGHAGGYLDSSYFRAQEETHLKEYMKAVSNLSVTEPRMEMEKQNVKISNMEEMNKQLRRRVEELEGKLESKEVWTGFFNKFERLLEDDEAKEKFLKFLNEL